MLKKLCLYVLFLLSLGISLCYAGEEDNSTSSAASTDSAVFYSAVEIPNDDQLVEGLSNRDGAQHLDLYKNCLNCAVPSGDSDADNESSDSGDQRMHCTGPSVPLSSPLPMANTVSLADLLVMQGVPLLAVGSAGWAPVVAPPAGPVKPWLIGSRIKKFGAAMYNSAFKVPATLGSLGKNTCLGTWRFARATCVGAWNLWWGRRAILPAYKYFEVHGCAASLIQKGKSCYEAWNAETRKNRFEKALLAYSQAKYQAIKGVALRTTFNTVAVAVLGGVIASRLGCPAYDIAGVSMVSGSVAGLFSSLCTYYRAKVDLINERRHGIVDAALKDGIKSQEVRDIHIKAKQKVGRIRGLCMARTVRDILELQAQKCPELPVQLLAGQVHDV